MAVTDELAASAASPEGARDCRPDCVAALCGVVYCGRQSQSQEREPEPESEMAETAELIDRTPERSFMPENIVDEPVVRTPRYWLVG